MLAKSEITKCKVFETAFPTKCKVFETAFPTQCKVFGQASPLTNMVMPDSYEYGHARYVWKS